MVFFFFLVVLVHVLLYFCRFSCRSSYRLSYRLSYIYNNLVCIISYVNILSYIFSLIIFVFTEKRSSILFELSYSQSWVFWKVQNKCEKG